jgi:hypothetical protein
MCNLRMELMRNNTDFLKDIYGLNKIYPIQTG